MIGKRHPSDFRSLEVPDPPSSNDWKRGGSRPWLAALLAAVIGFGPVARGGTNGTTVTVQPGKVAQEFQGMGCGAIFYEAHITSLAARGKTNEQERLYDAMFRDVNTDYLHLFIRHDHEPQNDNDDPYVPAFRDEDFGYCRHTLAICEAAKRRRPGMKLYGTLYTPPAWMKTNNDPGGGGKARATLRPGLELELAEYCWAFLDHMRRHGQPVDYLSIANECDWPHTQPGYFLGPEEHAALFAKVAAYLDEMQRRFPDTPKPKLIAPNGLSAVDGATKYLPPLLARAGAQVDIVGSHDYDRRGHRWRQLVEASGGRPVWGTEWCVNGPDHSPDLINSASEFWLAMSEAFNDGANAWMAYDWVYPPRPGGEALIHVEWGSRFKLTKIYHGFRQWCAPLAAGMRVSATEVTGECAGGISKPGVKACAFLAADGSRLVLHVANVQDRAADIDLRVPAWPAAKVVHRVRTGADDNVRELPPPRADGVGLHDTLAPRALTTYEFVR